MLSSKIYDAQSKAFNIIENSLKEGWEYWHPCIAKLIDEWPDETLEVLVQEIDFDEEFPIITVHTDKGNNKEYELIGLKGSHFFAIEKDTLFLYQGDVKSNIPDDQYIEVLYAISKLFHQA